VFFRNKNSILKKFGVKEKDFTEIVDSNPSLRGMILGYVAEKKFQDQFLHVPGVEEVKKDDDHDRSRKGDRRIRYFGKEFLIEVKSIQSNSVKKNPDGTYVGKAQVDASDSRNVVFPDGSELKTTCLLRDEFDILAVNLFAFTGKWDFVFIKNKDLPQNKFRKYSEYQQSHLLPTSIPVTYPSEKPFENDLRVVLNSYF